MRVERIVRIRFQHDPILIALGVDRRDLTLREGVVQRGVDGLDADAELRGQASVNIYSRLQAVGLPVGCNIGQARNGL